MTLEQETAEALEDIEIALLDLMCAIRKMRYKIDPPKRNKLDEGASE